MFDGSARAPTRTTPAMVQMSGHLEVMMCDTESGLVAPKTRARACEKGTWLVDSVLFGAMLDKNTDRLHNARMCRIFCTVVR